MPAPSLRPCRTRLCAALVRGGGFCPDCRGTRDDRPTTNALYGRQWKKHSTWFRTMYPYCGDRPEGCRDTSDSLCRSRGLYYAGTKVAPNVIDHVQPVMSKNDPTYLDPLCHQTLCQRCHALKRQREARGW